MHEPAPQFPHLRIWIVALTLLGHLGIRGVGACEALTAVLSLLAHSERSVNVRRSCGSKAGVFFFLILLDEQAACNFGQAHTQRGLTLLQEDTLDASPTDLRVQLTVIKRNARS